MKVEFNVSHKMKKRKAVDYISHHAASKSNQLYAELSEWYETAYKSTTETSA